MPAWSLLRPAPGWNLHIAVTARGIVSLEMRSDRESFLKRLSERLRGFAFDHDDSDPIIREASLQLAHYFGGSLRSFDLPLDLRGTEFQKQVWSALLEIPYGETRSYAQIAESIGNRKGVRAVGHANGRNPVPIVVPCHRVIGADGKLTGFGGGVDLKERLLALEAGGKLREAAVSA